MTRLLPRALSTGVPAQRSQSRSGRESRRARHKKRAKTKFTSQKGPKVRQTWGEREGGWREKRNCGATGEMGQREAKLNSHAYMRAAGRAGRGPIGMRGAQPNTPRVWQHHRDGGRASPGTSHGSWTRNAGWSSAAQQATQVCALLPQGCLSEWAQSGANACPRQSPSSSTEGEPSREPPGCPLPGTGRAELAPLGSSLQLPERAARP